MMTQLLCDAAYLQGLEVRKTFRRQGIAGLLIERLEDQARLDGRSRVTVVVEPDNDASLAFFGNLGYQVFKHSIFLWDGESLPVVCLEKSIRSKITCGVARPEISNLHLSFGSIDRF